MKQGLLHIKLEMDRKQTWDAVHANSKKIVKLQQLSKKIANESMDYELEILN